MSISFKDIAARLAGMSTAPASVSWTLSSNEKEEVRTLIVFLEERRALFTPYDMENPHFVVASIREVRARLSKALRSLDASSEIVSHLRIMRSACRRFLDFFDQKMVGRRFSYHESLIALGELRGVFGLQIALLCARCEIDIEGEMDLIFPVADDED